MIYRYPLCTRYSVCCTYPTLPHVWKYSTHYRARNDMPSLMSALDGIPAKGTIILITRQRFLFLGHRATSQCVHKTIHTTKQASTWYRHRVIKHTHITVIHTCAAIMLEACDISSKRNTAAATTKLPIRIGGNFIWYIQHTKCSKHQCEETR